MYTESRKMALKNLFTGQQWRKRCREWTYGHGKKGGEGEMYGKSNMETYIQFSSVQLLSRVRLLVTPFAREHTLQSQHARPPCPSPAPRVHSNSRPSSQWCHPAISSSVVPVSSCPQSLPASQSSPMSQLFAWAYVKHIAYGNLLYGSETSNRGSVST